MTAMTTVYVVYVKVGNRNNFLGIFSSKILAEEYVANREISRLTYWIVPEQIDWLVE